MRDSCLGGICGVFRHDCTPESAPLNQHLREEGHVAGEPEGGKRVVYADENSLYGSSVSLFN